MGLISKLKSLLGVESSRSGRERDAGVTVERERGSERDVEEPVATETDAAASTESLVEGSVEEGDADSPAEAAEPAEAAGPDEADMETDIGESVDANTTVEEPVAAETEAAASTESLVDEAVEEAEPESSADAAEPAEAAGPSEADMETDVDGVEPGADEDGVADTEGAEDVEIIKGVGPAYAERLRDAGVETVDDLASADAEELAERIDLSPKRVQRWIDRASEREE